MNQTTEEIIASDSLERIKSIIQNGDFWGSPGAAKTSAEALNGILSFRQSFGTLEKRENPKKILGETLTKEDLADWLTEQKLAQVKASKQDKPKPTDGEAPTDA